MTMYGSVCDDHPTMYDDECQMHKRLQESWSQIQPGSCIESQGRLCHPAFPVSLPAFKHKLHACKCQYCFGTGSGAQCYVWFCQQASSLRHNITEDVFVFTRP